VNGEFTLATLAYNITRLQALRPLEAQPKQQIRPGTRPKKQPLAETLTRTSRSA
jgi:hypothetical protein